MATQTINLTKKFETPMLDCYTAESFTDRYAGKRFDFAGVKSITVYSSLTVANEDYTRSGSSRYTTSLTELGDEIQELTMTKDRSFAFTIDEGNAAEQMQIKKANERMQHQWKSVATPEMDKYRLDAWANGNGLSSGKSVLSVVQASLTKSNVIETIMKANIAMSNALVPYAGRVLFISQTAALNVKLADQIIGVDKLAEQTVVNGKIGRIDQTDIVLVPDTYMPSGVHFLIKHTDATVDPVKIKSYKIHKDPPGINGELVEGRWMYDAFVLDNYANGICVCSAS